jgi:hypothetical protein
MIPVTVSFVSSVSRLISLYVFPTLYHAYISARFSIVVSRREVIALEGIFKEKREERKFVGEIFMVGWWGGGVCGSFSKLGFTKNRVFTSYTRLYSNAAGLVAVYAPKRIKRASCSLCRSSGTFW